MVQGAQKLAVARDETVDEAGHRLTRGTECGTRRSMCGADAGCSAIIYQSLMPDPLASYGVQWYLAHKVRVFWKRSVARS